LKQLEVTIGSLPDEVLLKIFQAAIVIDNGGSMWCMTWQRLVHVCRRWRGIVFASPLSLDLRLYCRPQTQVRKMLIVWPALPLCISVWDDERERRQPNWEKRWDNVVAAMECHDRIRRIHFSYLSSSLWAQVSTMMQESFPALTEVNLWCKPGPGHLSDSFLNGSAPRLRHLTLESVSFPSLRKFLLSTSDLKSLFLKEIPNDWYISPEAMATSLSALTKLESLSIEFASPTPQPKRRTRRLPPHTRSVLSALTSLYFKGTSEYLEVLAAQINAPILERLRTRFFNQLVFDIPQLSWFIDNTRIPRLSGLSLHFAQGHVAWRQPGSHASDRPYLYVAVLGKGLDWQVFSIAQICNQILPLCSSVEWLNVEYDDFWDYSLGRRPPRMRRRNMDYRLWLELFHSFISVKRLEISDELEPFIAAALQGLTEESATGVFPTLNSLSIVGDASDRATRKGIQSFVTSRQHSGHSVSLHRLSRWTQRL
jgi:F-box-like